MPENQSAADDDIGNVIDYVKRYARQEIVGPIEGAPKWAAFGIAGTFLFGIGLVFVVLGALRFVQTEYPGVFHRVGWSLLSYAGALLICVVVGAFGVRKIKKPTLEKGSPKP